MEELSCADTWKVERVVWMRPDLQRYELKYMIPERLCGPICAFLRPYTHPDEFTQKSKGGYIITSLYLDSPELTLHQAKQHKQLNRFKLRIRTYGQGSEGPIFCEVKRKIKGVILKRRVQVKDPNWTRYEPDSSELLVDVNDYNVRVMREFVELCERLHVGPSMLVRYKREAYVSEVDDYARVTFDRCMLGHLPEGYRLDVDPSSWIPLDDIIATEVPGSAVLEIKFAGRAPLWMFDLVQRFGLHLRGFSKYSTAVQYGLDTYFPKSSIRVAKGGYP